MSTTESIQTGNGVEVTRSLHQVIQRNLRVNHLALHKKLMVSQPNCSHVVLQEVCWTPYSQTKMYTAYMLRGNSSCQSISSAQPQQQTCQLLLLLSIDETDRWMDGHFTFLWHHGYVDHIISSRTAVAQLLIRSAGLTGGSSQQRFYDPV